MIIFYSNVSWQNIFASPISNEFKSLAGLLVWINLIVYVIIRVLIRFSNIMPT